MSGTSEGNVSRGAILVGFHARIVVYGQFEGPIFFWEVQSMQLLGLVEKINMRRLSVSIPNVEL